MVSAVVCLEDAVADEDVAFAERNVVRQLSELARSRARRPAGVRPGPVAAAGPGVVSGLGRACRVLSGFVLPKFTRAPVARSSRRSPTPSARPAAAAGDAGAGVARDDPPRDARGGADRMREPARQYRDLVLAVRIGATDLGSASASGATGTSRSTTSAVADVIADVVNLFGRADGTGFVITGPVWEYFAQPRADLRPQLRQTPFAAQDADGAAAAADEPGPGRADPRGRARPGQRADRQDGDPPLARRRPCTPCRWCTHEEYLDALDVLGPRRPAAASRASSTATR